MRRTKGLMANRRAWGSIRYDDASRTGYIRYMATGPDGYRRRTKTVRGTRTDCELECARLMLAHSGDKPVPTVGEMYRDHYLPRKEAQIASGDIVRRTLKIYTREWKLRIAPTWEDVPVNCVAPLAVQRWIDTLTGCSPRFAIPLFRRIMDYAVKYEYIEANPIAEKYDLPSKSTVARRDGEAYSAAELCRLWEATWDTPVEAVVLLCGFGSCRVGEALAVTAEKVNPIDGLKVPVSTIKIDNQLDERGRPLQRTKTAESARSVVIAGNPAIRVAELSRNAGRGYLAMDMGEPLPQHKVREEFKRAAARAGLVYHYPKNLRKTWQTTARWLLRMPEAYTEPMMGHVIPTVTGQHYDKPTTEDYARVLAEHYAAHPYADNLPWYNDRTGGRAPQRI